MAKRPIKRIDYHNPGTAPITFEQGTSPNDYPEEVEVLPGETYKGYANYYKFYQRQGLKVGPSPTAGRMREEAASVASSAADMLAEANSAKLEALEAKREAEAAKADAELAIAAANSARATAALTEQRDDEDDVHETSAPAAPPEPEYPEVVEPEPEDLPAALAPVADGELAPDPKIEKAKAARANAKRKKGKK